MRSVKAEIGGRAFDLRLTIDDLDKIAAVNPQFGELSVALGTDNLWDWREIRVILDCALAPHKMSVKDVYDGKDINAALEMARLVFSAALPQVKPGKPEAAAKLSNSKSKR